MRASICSGVIVAAVGGSGLAPWAGAWAEAHREAATAAAVQTSVEKCLFLIVSCFRLRSILNAVK